MFSSAQQDFQFTPTGHSIKRKNFLLIKRPDKLLKFINKSNCAKFSGSACAIDDGLTFAIFGSSSSWIVGTLWELTQRSLASVIEQSLKFFPKIWRILLWAPQEFYYAEGLADTSIRITFMCVIKHLSYTDMFYILIHLDVIHVLCCSDVSTVCCHFVLIPCNATSKYGCLIYDSVTDWAGMTSIYIPPSLDNLFHWAWGEWTLPHLALRAHSHWMRPLQGTVQRKGPGCRGQQVPVPALVGPM